MVTTTIKWQAILFAIIGFYFVLLCIFELRTQHGCERTHGQTGIAGALMDHSYEAYNI